MRIVRFAQQLRPHCKGQRPIRVVEADAEANGQHAAWAATTRAYEHFCLTECCDHGRHRINKCRHHVQLDPAPRHVLADGLSFSS